VHPVRHGLAQSCPIVAGALREAQQIDEPTVDVDAPRARSAPEGRLTKSSQRRAAVDHCSADDQVGDDVVKIWGDVAPELGAAERSAGLEHGRLTVGHERFRSLQLAQRGSRHGIDDLGRQQHGLRRARLVLDLGLDVDRQVSARSGDVGKRRRIDVDARCEEVIVQGIGLVNLAWQMQPDVPDQTAIVRVESLAPPLEADACRRFDVVVAVVDPHGEHVLRGAKVDLAREIDATRGDAVVEDTHLRAVDVEAGSLFDALELDDHFVIGVLGGDLEMFSIPGWPGIRGSVTAGVADQLGV
jgi:hypothetical protein